MVEYGLIKDSYGYPLTEPDEKPTTIQSVYSWALVNELLSLGHCNNFLSERSDIAEYIHKVSALIDKAEEIIKINPDDHSPAIGDKIIEALRQNGMNTRELADLAGISEVHLYRIMNGKQEPKATVAYKIASVLHVDIGYLIGLEAD